MLHLIVPSLFHPWPTGELELPRLPALELVIARGRRTPGAGSYAETLFTLFQIPAAARATAPFCWLGLSGEPSPAWVMHADPVHFRADRDRLLLFTLPDHDLSPDETEQFLEAFNRHFSADGLRLHAPADQQWFLTVERPPRAEFTPLQRASGRPLDDSLPKGSDASHWRGLMNEVQMLFHALSVNQRREARRALPVNGLWFSGAGRDATPVGTAPEVVSGQDECLLRGLLLGAAERDLDQRLRLFPQVERAIRQQDADAFLQAFRELDALVGLQLREERLFSLHSCDGWILHWQTRDRWRFWRRRKPLAGGPERRN